MIRAALTASLLALLACSPSPSPPQANVPVPVPVPVPASPASSSTPPELFGAPFSDQIPSVTLATLIKDPAPYNGQIIETSGKVSQVCQAAGCWMELSAEGSSERVRTPMAGHAFFLPKTVVGKQARVQGRVELIALSDAMKKHLEAEGAEATGSKLSLSALSVSVQ